MGGGQSSDAAASCLPDSYDRHRSVKAAFILRKIFEFSFPHSPKSHQLHYKLLRLSILNPFVKQIDNIVFYIREEIERKR